ncbi:flavin reductase family protein [Microbacterium amylolyticum]|uniref:flavin reductase family protein n=1 Tax=Microbacterium amylolyticum TaxID=936337 RepID=UPI00360802DE
MFIAGGIGITPILPMIHAAADAGADWVLHYAARSREALVSLDELQCYGDRVRVYVSEEGRRIDPSTLIDEAGAAPIWACGPERMITALTDAATQHTNLQAERFAPGALPAPAWRGPFDVELASTGDVISVGEDTSILEALEERGVFAVSSCREGTCGTCETVVIEGDVDHRDRVLTASERETSPVMMICVSRAACSRLVLDV